MREVDHTILVFSHFIEGPNQIPLCIPQFVYGVGCHGQLDCLCLLASVDYAVVTMTAEVCNFSAPFPKSFGYIACIRIEIHIYPMC